MLITSLKLITSLVNYLHDKLIQIAKFLGFQFTDKQLHFWVIGIIGILSFLIVNRLFEKIARYSISLISFIYTFTVLVVIVFAIEIEQKLTGHGNMEFLDIVEGLRGFFVVMLIYLSLRLMHFGLTKVVKHIRS
jgi:hypothetical protein